MEGQALPVCHFPAAVPCWEVRAVVRRSERLILVSEAPFVALSCCVTLYSTFLPAELPLSLLQGIGKRVSNLTTIMGSHTFTLGIMEGGDASVSGENDTWAPRGKRGPNFSRKDVPNFSKSTLIPLDLSLETLLPKHLFSLLHVRHRHYCVDIEAPVLY